MSALHRLLTLFVAVSLPALSHGQLDRLLTPVPTDATASSAESPRNLAARSQTPSHILSAEVLLAELEKELSTRLSLNGDLKLTLAQPWKPLTLPAADFAIVIAENPSAGITGTFVIRARITSAGKIISESQLSLRAQLWQDVWTAANRLERGQTLDRSLLTTSKVDVIRERQPSLLAEVNPSVFEVAQTISAGRSLTLRDVIERPLVRRGQVVEVIAHHGQLSIRMKALALESGASGSLIKLRNIESRKEFSGQILNENKVQVHF